MVGKFRVLLSLTSAVAIFGIVACAKVPQAEIDQADIALSSASDAEAAIYAQTEWETAQAAMNAAKAEVEAQNAKFALVRSYKKAQELLATAKNSAGEAEQAAIDGKEAKRLEVANAVATIESGLTEAEDHLDALQNCRKRPKGFAADLDMLRGKTDGLAVQLREVTAAADAEDYSEAATMARELQNQVDALLADLQNARTSLGC